MCLRKIFGVCLVVSILASSLFFAETSQAAKKKYLPWKIKRTLWSEGDERAYEEFVSSIGKAVHERKCRKLDSCIKSPANPYRASDPEGVNFYSDCADLPYALRGYFAWKNSLPFGFVSGVEAAPGKGGNRDIRYTKFGNIVTGRKDVISEGKDDFPNSITILSNLSGRISSAMFRFDPVRENVDLFVDHYPVKITRESIRPGTVIYDPNGHVAVVSEVTDDGRVLYIDAHPDNSLTAGTYGKKFVRSSPGMGSGFKNWRPIELIGAKQDGDGNFIGGKLKGLSNAEISDYSLEQFFGTEAGDEDMKSMSYRDAIFSIEGQAIDYYDYVRRKLSKGTLVYKPVDEIRNMLLSLCVDIQDRITAVDHAITAGIHRKTHPEKLPKNIYGTDGEWEEFSSPSRDARLKASFKEMRDRTQEFVEKHSAGDKSIEFDGAGYALKIALFKVIKEESLRCVVSYMRSNGEPKELNLYEVMNRLYKLSFDPYHCAELRWGAESAEELQYCTDSDSKRAWYAAEQRLRNQIDRTYDVRMDFTLQELSDPTRNENGVDDGPDVDVIKYLIAR